MAAPVTNKKNPNKTPQELVGEFWDKFFSKKQGKVTSIFPRSLYKTLLPPDVEESRYGAHSARNAAESYAAAAAACEERVRRIVVECNRTKEKFTDPDFDIGWDPEKNCLRGLVRPHEDDWSADSSVGEESVGPRGPRQPGRGPSPKDPGSTHRIDWIFDSPQWTVNGYSASDIKQGGNGDCWWLAAVATLAHRRDIMDRVMVARDEDAGVYGFVFFKEGEYISVVVDDNLYLKAPDFFDCYGDWYDATGKRAREYKRRKQTGSEALFFAKCEDQNETWLPLLEKAYAKIHGDYEAISGGWCGEGVEDMTGGVTSTIDTSRVLRKDKLWKELANSDGDFVFALSTPGTGRDCKRGDLALGHAYSLLKATEEVDEDGTKVRLVQIRNPWGQRDWKGVGEWNGPWSDGSKEWTPYWLKKLKHKFGDDGCFWMSFQDMLDNFVFLHRTRLFDEKWTVVQQWTSVKVGWVSGYLNTKFTVEVKKSAKVIVVLTQLDDRYFQGLEGQYTFDLHFVLKQENSQAGEHICRVRPVNPWEKRSVSCEVELQAGRYDVVPKLAATRDPKGEPVEDVVRKWADRNPQKLRQVGMAYDLAHAKGGVPDEDGQLLRRQAEADRKAKEKKRREREKARRHRKKVAKEGDSEKKVEAKPAGDGDAKDDQPKLEKNKEAKDGNTADGETGKKEAGDKTDGDANQGKKEPLVTEEAPQAEKSSWGVQDGAEMTSENDGKKDDEKEDKDKKDKKDKKDEEKEEKDSDEEDDEEDDEDEDEAAVLGDNDGRLLWNAVCVIGLRVYALDPNVSVELIQPKDLEEGASLAMEDQPAGATM